MKYGDVSSVRRRVLVVAAAVVAVLAVAFSALALTHRGSSSGTASAATSSASSAVRNPSSMQPPAGMATVPLSQLPPEAQQVVKKIDSGGAFTYRQDGATFANRERLLPREPSGYYREYTVTTPGAVDRGARRIISGRQGELYYTSDHYASFQWIVRSTVS